MTKVDQNFDELAEHFVDRVYGRRKGDIRLHMLWREMTETLPLSERPLKVLDIGGGAGQISTRLIKQGHEVVLCDASSAMLAHAERYMLDEGVEESSIQLRHCSLQDIAREDDQYDLVLFHAVLEWMAYPETALAMLSKIVRPGGWLSLMFYNKHSVVLKNALKGNFKKVMSGDYSGMAGGLTPQSPLEPEDVYQWANDAGFDIRNRAGIRVVHDYLSRQMLQQRDMESLLALEEKLFRQEPFLSLGRYIHVSAQRR